MRARFVPDLSVASPSASHNTGLFWPTVLSVIMLAVLLGLGAWQLQRKAWKDGLITRIENRASGEPVSIASAEAKMRATGDIEYLRVRIRGRFRHDLERYLYVPAPGGLGFHVYTPLEGDGRRVLWVNRGFVPEALKDPGTRSGGLPSGPVEVIGLVRASAEKGLFVPANQPERNLWFWRSLPEMHASAFGATGVDFVPFFVDAEARPAPYDWPKAGVTNLRPSNRHLEYALTWYGLAIALIVVYAVFAFGWRGSAQGGE
jgi:surfeit locus 1 family protein